MPKGFIRADDIYQIRQPLQCAISPDGRRLAVVVSQPDRKTLKNLAHLWMVRLGPSAEGDREPRQFTQGNSSERNPRWSPNGRTLAFTSNRSGKTEIWTIPADGGEARQLTRMKGEIESFAWHPKGRRLVVAFTPQDPEDKEREEKKKRGEPGADAPRVRDIRRLFYKMDGAGFLPVSRCHLYMVDAGTGRYRPLTDDDRFEEGQPTFSPDGRWVYFISNRTDDPDRYFRRTDIWRMPAGGGGIRKVRNFDGPSSDPSLSPDGKWLAFLGTPDPDAPSNQTHTKLWLTPSAGGRAAELTPDLDRSCRHTMVSDTFGMAASRPPLWSPDSKLIYFVVSNEGNQEIWRVRPKAGRAEPVLNAPGALIDYEIDFARGWIHSVWSDLHNPGEIRSDPLPLPRDRGLQNVALPDRAGLPLPLVRTTFNTAWLSRRRLALPEEIWFEGKQRHRLQGWILNPPGFNRTRKYPGVLYIHGGPAMQYGRIYFHEFQVLAAAGYVVFYCNPRGGTGYSEKHLNAIVNRWGTIDYDDLMAFTDTVLRRSRHLDRRRLGVAGGSYGGYMTNWIIGHTGRFACAVSSRSISNLMSFAGSTDFNFIWTKQFGGAGPWDAPQHFLKMSPLTYLNRMKTPTLIDHQEEDHRCPIEQGEQLFAALKAKDIPTEFLRYPGEPHGMSRGGRPDRKVDRMERIIGWLNRWLKKRSGGSRKP
jgi:dipeptidyl aminopeptidase/acylaminoacyl peptidase